MINIHPDDPSLEDQCEPQHHGAVNIGRSDVHGHTIHMAISYLWM